MDFGFKEIGIWGAPTFLYDISSYSFVKVNEFGNMKPSLFSFILFQSGYNEFCIRNVLDIVHL